MNEADLWAHHVKHRLDELGRPTRLENAAAASVPDIVMLATNLTMFIEMKIDRGGYFYTSPFQNAWGRQASWHLKSQQHWYFVWNDELEGCMAFTFSRVKSMKTEMVSGKLRVEWKPVWDKMPKQFVLNSRESYKEWLDLIRSVK